MSADYLSRFASQALIFGDMQLVLRKINILFVAFGRENSTAALALLAAGVEKFLVIEPQSLEPENLNSLLFCLARGSDIGKNKGLVFRRIARRVSGAEVRCLAAGVEDPASDAFFSEADVVVSGAGSIKARIVTAQKAIQHQKLLIDVGIADGREALAGSVHIWVPGNPGLACPACLLFNTVAPTPVQALLATTVSILASIAANMVVQYFTGRADAFLGTGRNYFAIDASSYEIHALKLVRFPDCPACGRVPCSVAS